jgi:hypothetical protein
LVLSAIVGTLGIGALNPVGVLAATKVVDSRQQNISVTSPAFADQLCGVTTVFQETQQFGQFSTILWDNGHFLLSFTFRDYIADAATGTLIVTGAATRVEVEGAGALPLHVTRTVAGTCTPASGVPGQEVTIVFSGTINEQGVLTQEHITEVLP